MGKIKDLTGQRFGRLFVLYPTDKRVNRRVVWHCICDCGNYKDVVGSYCPENCIWVTMKEQENNKRNNHFLTYDGVTKTLAQWSEELGINYGTLKSRINKLGWTTEEALEITKRLRPNFVKDIED